MRGQIKTLQRELGELRALFRAWVVCSLLGWVVVLGMLYAR